MLRSIHFLRLDGALGALLLALAAGGNISIVHASEAEVLGKARSPEWNDSSHQECKVGCNYLRANENLSLQAQYITHKMEGLARLKEKWDAALQDATQVGTSSPDFSRLIAAASSLESQLKSEGNLGRYCVAGEDTSSCYGRYWQNELMKLQQFRSQISINTAQVNSLRARSQPGIEGSIPGFLPEPDPNQPEVAKKPQVTEVVSLDEIAKTFNEDSGNLEVLAGERYQEWIKQLPNPPDESGFYVFKTIERYPGVPNGEKLQVAVRGPDGSLVIDRKAFEAAKWVYKNQLRNLDQAKKDFMAQSKLPTAPKSKVKFGVTAESRQAFAEARMDMIDAARRAMKQAGLPAKGRQPSPLAVKLAGAQTTPASGGGTKPPVSSRGTQKVDPQAPVQAGSFGADPANEKLGTTLPTDRKIETNVTLNPEDLNREIKNLEEKGRAQGALSAVPPIGGAKPGASPGPSSARVVSPYQIQSLDVPNAKP